MTKRKLPVVRIQKITLENFKNVKYGEITLECGRNFVPRDTRSDVLALYGQNGSGKSVLVEALDLLKKALSGSSIDEMSLYSNHYISDGADHARLGFLFEIQFSPKEVYQTLYEFSIKYIGKSNNEDYIRLNSDNGFIQQQQTFNKDLVEGDYSYTIFNEVLQIAKYQYTINPDHPDQFKKNTVYRMHTVINTSSDGIFPFTPAAKRKLFLDNDNKTLIKDHNAYKSKAEAKFTSYIFYGKTLESFRNSGAKETGEYQKVLSALQIFGKLYLQVLSNLTLATSLVLPRIWGPISLLPKKTQKDIMDMSSDFFITDDESKIDNSSYLSKEAENNKIDPYEIGPLIISDATEDEVTKINAFFDKCLNVLLGKLIPGVRASLEYFSEDALHKNVMPENSKADNHLMIMIQRNNTKLPLMEESDGVKRLIFFAYLFICAYNNPEYTIVIDELDANIFEHLLCDLLGAFQNGGQGQLIFTSHNLRLLEILDKKSLYFTTTNPENRYVQLKGIGNTNNVRLVYQRSLMGLIEQDEELYDYSSRNDLEEALTMTGLYFEENENNDKTG